MQNIAYFAISVIGMCAVWFVWDLGLKKVFLDGFRERLFELRFELFSLGSAGEVNFDSDVYRSIELLICGLLRFAHRTTFMVFFFSLLEQKKARSSKDFEDYHKQIQLKVSQTPPETQVKLQKILSGVSKAVILYASVSSLIFLMSVPVLGLMGMLRRRKTVSVVFEAEAYRAESRRKNLDLVTV